VSLPPMALMLSAASDDATTTKAPSETAPAHDVTLIKFLTPAQIDGELGRLGKYRILDILGHGGMGVVYKAEDSVLDRVVALKAILPSLGVSESARKRFLREARTMARLEHDHIVRLYEVGEDRGIPFLAMEFLVGESLDHRLLRDPVLPLADSLRIGREIAEGLATAHALELIHRDIKPANIFLTGQMCRVKILDFGLARAVADDSRITQSGAILGSPGYMAPEQTRGEKADFRADLFSLGVVLYRTCTGTQPFTAADALSTMMAVATKNPLAPQTQNLAMPTELSNLIMKLLEKDPAQRPPSALAAAEEIRQIERRLRGEIAATPIATAEQPPIAPSAPALPEVKRQDRQQLPWLWIVIAVGAVSLCLILSVAAAAIVLFS
jgi:serine/threonine protein kinase